MNKKKLTRLIALCTACLGMGVFAFSGCKKGKDPTEDKNGTEATTPTTPETPGGGTTTPTTPENPGGGTTTPTTPENPGGSTTTPTTPENPGGSTTTPTTPPTETGKDPSKPGSPLETPPEPEITGPVQGAPTITKASAGELESAYVEWTAADNAKWYNVYYSAKGANNWVRLDAPLVRQYKDYYRADMVGLKAGAYDMKVVPVSGEDTEATDLAATAGNITVNAHDRSGYAFVKGTSSGAYNEDGTLIAGANVIYVTDANKDTVELNGVTGVQNILQAQKKATVPLSVRFIGNISSPAVPDKSFNKNENSLQAKENAKGLTLEGIGNDATANGWTLRLVNTENVEVRNLGCMNTKCSEPDGISIEKGNHIWVHNCDIFYGGAGGDNDQAKGDGALDTKLATYVTHSYNHFYDTGKSNLQGMKNEEVTNYITYHHNWYDHSDSRHPRIRTCTVHIYNNYFDGNAKYGVGVTTGASAFVEKNYFRSTVNMKPMLVSGQGTDAKGEGTFSGESGGIIKAYGNYFDGKYSLITQNDTADKSDIDCYLATSRDEIVPAEYKAIAGTKNSEGAGVSYSNFDTASDFYEYTVDSAEDAKVKVERYAGRVQGGDFKWEFDNATEDGNYALIKGLKDALVAYKSDLVKVGGVAVSGGTTTGGNTGTGEGEGGDEPVTPPATIEGEIKFVPSASGSIFTVSGNTDTNSTAKTVDGVSIPEKRALKLESATYITFSIDKAVTLTVYLDGSNIKVDGTKIVSGSSADGLSVITVELAAGEHKLEKADKATLYLIKLTPKS